MVVERISSPDREALATVGASFLGPFFVETDEV